MTFPHKFLSITLETYDKDFIDRAEEIFCNTGDEIDFLGCKFIATTIQSDYLLNTSNVVLRMINPHDAKVPEKSE